MLPQPVIYLPGSTIGILAFNRTDEVDEIIEKLHFTEICDTPYSLTSNNAKKKTHLYLPQIITIRKVLTECLDIRSIPKKLFLRALIDCTTDEKEKRFLEILSSKEGSKRYSEFFEGRTGTFLSLIRTFNTCFPSFVTLLECLPRLLPRPYSITTSPTYHNGRQIKIIFSVENGLVTNYLQELIHDKNIQEKKIFIYFRQHSSFVFKEEHLNKKVIMIGPGTAVSPYLGFLAYKSDTMLDNINKNTGYMWLITGCRYENRSQLFKTEIQTYLKKGVLNRFSEAFSRDPGSKCRYVQDLIRANKQEFVEALLNPDTVLYACGEGKKILPGIENTIVQCLVDVNLISEVEALDIVKNLKKSQKYIEDIWF